MLAATQPVSHEQLPLSVTGLTDERTSHCHNAAVRLVDVTGDGRLDLVIADTTSIYDADTDSTSFSTRRDLLVNNGGGAFHWTTDNAHGIDLSDLSSACFADVDGDGDIDALIGGLIYLRTPGASPPYAVQPTSGSILEWWQLDGPSPPPSLPPAPPAPPSVPYSAPDPDNDMQFPADFLMFTNCAGLVQAGVGLGNTKPAMCGGAIRMPRYGGMSPSCPAVVSLLRPRAGCH